MEKRGYSYAEAMAYVGVKRRTFDEEWRPRLVAMPQGSSLIFDRADLDRLFEDFKREAAAGSDAANDQANQEQNAPRNGRPIQSKGEMKWAKERGASTPTQTAPGTSTSGGEARAFSSAVSKVMTKRKAG